MRLIALSIVIFAGAFMAAAGTIADALPSTRQYNELPLFGLLLVAAAGLMFVIEWWPTPGWKPSPRPGFGVVVKKPNAEA